MWSNTAKSLVKNVNISLSSSGFCSAHLFICGFATLFSITAFSVGYLLSPLSSADNAEAELTLTVSSSCSLTSTEDIAHTATIDSNTFTPDIGKSTISVACNDSGGYDIYAVGYTDNVYGKTVMSNSLGNTDYDIPTGTAISGATSNWSMKLTAKTGSYPSIIVNGFDTYSPIPGTHTKVATRGSHTDITTGSQIETTYGVYASPTQPAATYTGKVKFTLVHPSTTAPTTMYTLQNVATWGSSVTSGQTVSAYDTRDGQIYKVSRLADGKLWMMDNLNLGAEALVVDSLDSTNTNLASGVSAIPAATFNSWIKTAGTSSYTSPELIPLTATNSANSQAEDSYGNKYGTVYNYAAASAGTIIAASGANNANATSSLCPAGWRLPTGGSGGEFAALSTSYGGLATAMSSSTTPTGAEMSTKLQQDLGFSLAGGFVSGAPIVQGSGGGYWSSTRSGGGSMYDLDLDSSNVYPVISSGRYFGHSIKCVSE